MKLVDFFRKDNQDNWFLKTYEKNDELNFNSVNLTMTIREVYKDVFEI